MTGLVLKLKANEKVLINGIVLQNGDRPSRLRVRTPGVSVLRLRDALHPEDAVTPLRRLYYVAQLAVAGEVDEECARLEVLDECLRAANQPIPESMRSIYQEAEKVAREGKLFGVMRAVRKGFHLEEAQAVRGKA
jgi:flagellar protein FlbT